MAFPRRGPARRFRAAARRILATTSANPFAPAGPDPAALTLSRSPVTELTLRASDSTTITTSTREANTVTLSHFPIR